MVIELEKGDRGLGFSILDYQVGGGCCSCWWWWWSSEPVVIELEKRDRGLGFSILDYQVGGGCLCLRGGVFLQAQCQSGQ